MKAEPTVMMAVRITPEMRERIDRFRASHPFRPTVQVIVHQALEQYFATQAKAQPKKGRAA